MPKEPAWRSLPPTSRQLAMLRARGVSAPSTRGACSDAISRLLEDDDDKPRSYPMPSRRRRSSGPFPFLFPTGEMATEEFLMGLDMDTDGL